MDEMRLYDPDECGPDGYPREWHWKVKDAVRKLAGYRCERCGHPYAGRKNDPRISKGGEWSPCDEVCSHGQPTNLFRVGPGDHRNRSGEWEIYVEAKYRILTVHHLDGNKWNLLWWNLAALCQRCHLQVQNKVKMEQVYPFEHSEWFKPFAAGYYAFTYLGEQVTRDEAIDRMDELLALERVG